MINQNKTKQKSNVEGRNHAFRLLELWIPERI